MKSLIYLSQYFAFRVFKGFIMLFPEKTRFKIGESIGVLGYKLIKSRRITTLANLKLAFPEKTTEERHKIAIDSYKTMAKAFLGALWLDEYMKNDDNFKIHNIEVLDRALKKGPVVFATMHLGNMESLGKFSEKYPLITVAKKQRNPYLNKYITDQRKHLNIILLEKSKRTGRELLEYAEFGKNIALFTDHRDKGTNVEFFGADTVSPTGVSTIALKYNRPLILVYCIFTKDNKTEVFIEELRKINSHNLNFKENVHETTQKIIFKMEEIITKHPDQWMWLHDRWKLYKQVTKKKRK